MGIIRGFSGELGAILKLIVTGFIGYGILGYVVRNLDPSLIQNLFFPATIFTLTYIFVNFLSKITISPIVLFLRRFTPFIIDKILGVMLGTAKAMTIVLIIYNMVVQISDATEKELPDWLVGSYSEILLEEANVRFGPYLPNIKDLFALRKAQKGTNKINETLFNKYLGSEETEELLGHGSANRNSDEDSENQESNDDKKGSEGILGDKLKDIQKLMKHYQFMDKLDEEGLGEDSFEDSGDGDYENEDEIYGKDNLDALDSLINQLN